MDRLGQPLQDGINLFLSGIAMGGCVRTTLRRLHGRRRRRPFRCDGDGGLPAVENIHARALNTLVELVNPTRLSSKLN